VRNFVLYLSRPGLVIARLGNSHRMFHVEQIYSYDPQLLDFSLTNRSLPKLLANYHTYKSRLSYSFEDPNATQTTSTSKLNT
jgi:hypothetical protein